MDEMVRDYIAFEDKQHPNACELTEHLDRKLFTAEGVTSAEVVIREIARAVCELEGAIMDLTSEENFPNAVGKHRLQSSRSRTPGMGKYERKG